MENYMTLKLLAISQNEAFARSAVSSFCVGLNPTIEEISDIKTAVSEAVTNSIVHGYGSNRGEIAIEVLSNRGKVDITISDKGVGISDINKAMQPFYTTKAEDERSGMGFAVMQAMMDEVTVEHNEPCGLVVRMVKLIK